MDHLGLQRLNEMIVCVWMRACACIQCVPRTSLGERTGSGLLILLSGDCVCLYDAKISVCVTVHVYLGSNS